MNGDIELLPQTTAKKPATAALATYYGGLRYSNPKQSLPNSQAAVELDTDEQPIAAPQQRAGDINCQQNALLDAATSEISEVQSAWQSLPAHVRITILTMVRTFRPKEHCTVVPVNVACDDSIKDAIAGDGKTQSESVTQLQLHQAYREQLRRMACPGCGEGHPEF